MGEHLLAGNRICSVAYGIDRFLHSIVWILHRKLGRHAMCKHLPSCKFACGFACGEKSFCQSGIASFAISLFEPDVGVWGAAPCSPRALALGPAETVRAFAPWQADFQLRVQGCQFSPSYQSGIALRRSEHLPPGKPALSTASR